MNPGQTPESWDIPWGDVVARYRRTADMVGMELIPAAMLEQVVRRREHLNGPEVTRLPSRWGPFGAWNVDPLVHVKLVGDDCPGGFAQGRTLRGAGRLTYAGHTVSEDAGVTRVTTTLRHPSGLELLHELTWRAPQPFLTVRTTAVNGGDKPVSLELLTSFSLGGITPFDAADTPERLWIHRFRSGWSSEGRLESMPCELLGLDRSWSGR